MGSGAPLGIALVALLVGTAVAARRAGGLSRLGWAWQLAWALLLAELGARQAFPLPVEADRRGHDVPLLPAPPPVFLSADFAARPTAGPTVLFVGDSFTWGDGVDTDDALPAQVARGLAARGAPARVLNHGEPGLSFWDELVLFSTLGRRAEPDVVVWVVVLNDLGLVDAPSDLISEPGVPAPTGARLLDVGRRVLWERARGDGAARAYRAAWAADNPGARDFSAALAELARATREADARLVVAIYPLLHALRDYPFRDAHASIAAAARAGGAEVVDLLDVFEGRDEVALWVSLTDHHPRAEGHALAAEALTEALLAGPLDGAGAVPCAALPALPGYDDVLAPACAGAPADLWALAEALIRRRSPPRAPWSGELVGRTLAVVAAYDDPGLSSGLPALIDEAKAAFDAGPRLGPD